MINLEPGIYRIQSKEDWLYLLSECDDLRKYRPCMEDWWDHYKHLFCLEVIPDGRKNVYCYADTHFFRRHNIIQFENPKTKYQVELL